LYINEFQISELVDFGLYVGLGQKGKIWQRREVAMGGEERSGVLGRNS